MNRALDVFSLIDQEPYPDPEAVPLAHLNEMWHLACALGPLCPGLRLVRVEARGQGLHALDAALGLRPDVPAGSNECFYDLPALTWQGWALSHLGVCAEADLPKRAIEQMRLGIAVDGLGCTTAEAGVGGVLIHEHPDPPSQDEENKIWVARLHAGVQALILAAPAHNPAQRAAPRL